MPRAMISSCRQLPYFILAITVLCMASLVRADDWSGRFLLTPVSAPEMALEAVLPGTAESNVISINKPTGADNQIWIITPKEKGIYAISNAISPNRVLAASQGGTKNGTPAVLETDAAKPWQRWAIKINAAGSLNLVPMHAPDKGLDDLGGKADPGAKQDIWDCHPNDPHLQWMIKPLAGATVPAEYANAFHLDPLAPKGTIKEFTFADSRIFPGTHRNGTVFIPAQYDPAKPACVYVRQDGYNAGEKPILESLIAHGDMPVTVGVFVRPGDIKSPTPGTMGRRNRCFEYDAVNDNYVRFLIEELLPYVAKEFNLNLSNSGNDRCIAGGSSGGISAFNAAWQRPDAFTRVYANSGSFVAFRGGHEFPTMVRKFEPKPIRAYLTTGTHDMVNCAGEWFLLDQEMDKALEFSGYDYVFHAIEGRHVVGWIDNFPHAMKFIWKGWPEPVKPGAGAPRVRDVILPDETWALAGQGFTDARAPSVNAAGEIFFADPAADKIFRIGLDGKIEPFQTGTGHANAVSVGPKNELYAVSQSTGRITSYDAAGKQTVVAEGIPGRYVLARPDGALYVTGPGETPDAPSRVWRIANGKSTVVDTGLKCATGLAYRPDQWLLSVADGASKWLYSYQINDDGTLINKERFFWLHVADCDDDAGAEAVCYAREGQMFVATRIGVQITADDGPTQVILPVPDRSRVVGVCIGGKDGNTLYAFCGQKIWRRNIKLHGIGAFTPRTPIRGTPL